MQRKPVLHTRQPPPLGDCLIKRITSGIGTELLTIVAAEALDAVLIKQRLARGEQQVLIDAAGGPLRVGIEQPQRFQFVAEEIEPQALFQPAREYIEDRAAHGKFARVGNGISARIALPLQQLDLSSLPISYEWFRSGGCIMFNHAPGDW